MSVNHWVTSSMIITEEAKKMWLWVEIISKKKNLFYVKNKDKKILFKNVDFGLNSSLWKKLTDDKELCYKILDEHNLPIAKSYYLQKNEWIKSSKSSVNKIKTNNLKFPLVIKPIDEYHWNGVMMNILTEKELRDKLSISFKKYDNMIIQEEISWDEIRVLIVKWKIIVAMKRVPPTIIWDGKSSIKDLIDIENKLNPHRGEWVEKPHPLLYIKIDDEIISFIKKQWLTSNDIPNKWQKVQLRWNSNVWTWWTIIDVTNNISNDIKNASITACKVFWLGICGVDILTSDITKPLSETGWVILELNATPGLWGDRELTSINTWKEILKLLFS